MNLSLSQLLPTAKHLIKQLYQNLLLELKAWEGILNLRGEKISQGSRGRGDGIDGIYTMNQYEPWEAKEVKATRGQKCRVQSFIGAPCYGRPALPQYFKYQDQLTTREDPEIVICFPNPLGNWAPFYFSLQGKTQVKHRRGKLVDVSSHHTNTYGHV